MEFFPDLDAVVGLGVGFGVGLGVGLRVGLGLEVPGSSGSNVGETVGLLVMGAAVGGFVMTSELVTTIRGLIIAVITSPERSWIFSDKEPSSTILRSAPCV